MNKSTTTTPLKGYKKTTIGIIPENWEVMKLGDLGETFSGLSGKNKDDFGKGYPYIPYKNIFQNSKIDINYMDFVNVKENEKQHQVKYGDIFFTTSSETAIEVGMSSVLLEEVETMYLNSFCFGFRLKNYETLNPLFSSYLLRGEQIRKELTVLAQGSTRFNLSKSELLKLLIPIPPLPEQQKIAEILSTWDDAIANCKTTITTIKDRNKGLAQQLLTGKKRLKGYEKSQWHLKSVDEVAVFKNGKAHENCIDEDGDYFVVNSKFISTQGKVSKASNENLCPLFKNDITMVMSDIPNGKALAKCFYIPEDNKYTLNQRICALTAKVGTDSKFLYYQMNRNNYYLSFNNGVSQTNLKKEEVLECPLLMPDIEEQIQIVKVLETADQELKSYETKLVALQLQKKGLMQQLLTGKIRVNVK